MTASVMAEAPNKAWIMNQGRVGQRSGEPDCEGYQGHCHGGVNVEGGAAWWVSERTTATVTTIATV